MPSLQGRFVWYELMTPDVVGAVRFYAAVLGWTAREVHVTEKPYTIVQAGEAMVGGIMEMTEEACALGARHGWVGHVGACDVDEMATRLAAAGGEVRRPPEDIPGIGRFAVVLDPQRARFILFQPGDGPAPSPAPPGTPGTVGWHELHAVDGEAAFGCYAALFGWTEDSVIDMGPMGAYRIFAIDGTMAGGIMTRMDPAAPPEWRYYFNVAEIHAAVARVDAAGGQVVRPPQEVPGGSWIAQCIDPQGVGFAVVAPP